MADYVTPTPTEYRKGWRFKNPDLTSSYLYPEWGMPVTADELRYITFSGTKLVNPNTGYQYDDNHLNSYIQEAITMIENNYAIHILPAKVRYNGYVNSNGEYVERPEVEAEIAELQTLLGSDSMRWKQFFIREEGYQFNYEESRRFLFCDLDHRPVRKVYEWKWFGPAQIGSNQSNIFDTLMPYIKNYRPGSYDYYAQYQAMVPPNSLAYQILNQYGYVNVANPIWEQYPEAFKFDYDVGYEHSSELLADDFLRHLIYLQASVIALEDMSSALSPGIASASTNLGNLSQSYGTTASATNSLFGAQTINYRKQLEEADKKAKSRYNKNYFGVL